MAGKQNRSKSKTLGDRLIFPLIVAVVGGVILYYILPHGGDPPPPTTTPTNIPTSTPVPTATPMPLILDAQYVVDSCENNAYGTGGKLYIQLQDNNVVQLRASWQNTPKYAGCIVELPKPILGAIQPNMFLTFLVTGSQDGQWFKVGLKSLDNKQHDVPPTLSTSASPVRIPLSDFAGVDLVHLQSIVFNLEYPGGSVVQDNTIYISDIGFSR